MTHRFDMLNNKFYADLSLLDPRNFKDVKCKGFKHPAFVVLSDKLKSISSSKFVDISAENLSERAYVCVCVCVHVRACVRVCVCVRACVKFFWAFVNKFKKSDSLPKYMRLRDRSVENKRSIFDLMADNFKSVFRDDDLPEVESLEVITLRYLCILRQMNFSQPYLHLTITLSQVPIKFLSSFSNAVRFHLLDLFCSCLTNHWLMVFFLRNGKHHTFSPSSSRKTEVTLKTTSLSHFCRPLRRYLHP